MLFKVNHSLFILLPLVSRYSSVDILKFILWAASVLPTSNPHIVSLGLNADIKVGAICGSSALCLTNAVPIHYFSIGVTGKIEITYVFNADSYPIVSLHDGFVRHKSVSVTVSAASFISWYVM